MWWMLLACAARPCPDGEVRAEAGACAPYAAGTPVAADAIWRPDPGVTWQWQLTGALDTSLDVEAYDVDLIEVSDEQIATLRGDGRVLICYLSAGSWESWRADAGDYPEEALGRTLDGWEDERWVDVMHPQVRAILEARLDRAAARGCDAVEPDNVDGYANASGLPLNATEQLDFNRFLADAAHARGLSVGLKNDLDQLDDLQPWFDWALNEECVAYEECERYQAWLDAGLAVLHAEYVDDVADAPAALPAACERDPRLSTLVKTWDLGPEWFTCG